MKGCLLRSFKTWMDLLGPEDHHQLQIMNYIQLQYKTVATAWHTPNEGKRSKFERWKSKLLGLRPGVSDVCIICNGRFFALELKAGKNSLTTDQALFLEEVKARKCEGAVSWTFDDSKNIIDNFIKEAMNG